MAAFLKLYIKESLDYEMTIYKICITCMRKIEKGDLLEETWKCWMTVCYK